MNIEKKFFINHLKLNNLFILLYIYFPIHCTIKNGVYNFLVGNLYLCYDSDNKVGIRDNFEYPNTFFRIVESNNNFNDGNYNIEHILTNLKLSYSDNKELILSDNNSVLQLWNIIQINKIYFIIKNNNNCYIKIKKLKIVCDLIEPDEASQFKLIKLYDEAKEENNLINLELINKEPIDVLIKYIDLADPYLNRDGIHQIEKDFDNQELRYSIRSINLNIPWVRKIFILMPNDKVRYFKEYNSIKDKIVYVKDYDLLGYESSNSNAFQFRYWKMKKFGISDNIIVMDDDYFIGNKLKKSDFFQVVNGKVVPLIITSNFVKVDKESSQKFFDFFQKKAKYSREEQNNDIFLYSKYLTFLFILNVFNISAKETIYIPKFSHNAIPMNLKDIKDSYDLIYNSKYRYNTLDCPYRDYEYIQFQIFVVSYTFIKYNKTIKNIPSKFIQLSDAISSDYNISLFCINKGAGKYTYLDLYKERIIMEYIFPKPSQYEIIDYSLLNLTLNITQSMDSKIIIYERKISQMITKKEFYFLETFIFIFLLLIYFKRSLQNNYIDYNYD